ncbi:putative ATPase [Kickxella alabastrina]|uniref:ATPase n=1 Tax=Kickxella alabastrina TaxID=61397 RepID=A0ACC1IAV9_9FUNG|nr:putative ATPase [Kickxella alabastrina]
MAPVQYEYYQAVRGPNLRSFLQDRFAGVQAESPEGTLVPGTPASLEEPAEPAAVAAAATLAKRKKAAWTMNGKLVEEANAFLGAASSDGGSLAKAGKRGNGRKRPAYAEADENDAFSGDELDEPAHPPKDTMAKASSSGSGLSKLKADVLVRQLNLQFRLMQQRKVCQHPYLFDFPVTDPQDPESEFLIDEQLVRSSGKLLLLDRLLPELFANGHRVLIFSQFARVLDILEFYAELRSWKFCRIDGSVAQTDRQDAIVRFNTDPSIPLFFLTTRSGGLGINLTAADTVVIFDSDWNPQQDLQAQDRVHRIGQKRPVLIYRLIIAGSCERAILKRAKAKRKLEKLVIHDKKFKGLGSNNNNGGGASGGLKDDLSVQDIAQILLDDDTELVEKDQRELKRILESLGPDEQVPEEAILTREELLALTDRSSEAYLKKDDMGSGRIAEVVHVPDGRNDMLSKMETLI